MRGTGISGMPVIGSIIRLFRESSPQRKALLMLGGTTFLVGLALLAFGVYNLIDSGDSRPTPGIRNLSGTATPKPATASPTPLRTPILGDQPYNLVIEKLGVDAPVNKFGLDANSIPEVPTGSDAAQIVAWYDFSAKPGVGSNAVFAGHVTWNGRAVFYDLPSIAAGDVVKLRGSTGTEVVYKISQVFSVDPNDPNSLKVMGPSDHDIITIITCDGSFTHTGDPVFGGQYNSRLVVQGDLISVSRPAG